MNQQRGFTVGEILVGVFLLFLLGVFALPYFLHGSMPLCVADAPATIRTLNTTQTTYVTTFPDAGFAPNLAALGGWSSDKSCLGPSPAHSCLIDNVLGCPEGVGQAWCTYSNGYRYNIQRTSPSATEQNYWITATPIDAKPVVVERTWTDWLFSRPIRKPKPLKNYCSTGDASVRAVEGPPLSVPYTLAQCERLPELKYEDEEK